ncbi:streptophobe family protein, partial [Streptomyces sp. S6]
DGVAVKFGSGTGNLITGARLYNNSDDGIDLWSFSSPVAAGGGARRFVAGCAVRLGVVTGVALAVLAWVTVVSVDAGLSVLGVDAVGAGLELRGDVLVAGLLGVAWGVGAGALGAWLAWVSGAAGKGAARVVEGGGGFGGSGGGSGEGGPYAPRPSYRAPHPETNPYLRKPEV